MWWPSPWRQKLPVTTATAKFFYTFWVAPELYLTGADSNWRNWKAFQRHFFVLITQFDMIMFFRIKLGNPLGDPLEHFFNCDTDTHSAWCNLLRIYISIHVCVEHLLQWKHPIKFQCGFFVCFRKQKEKWSFIQWWWLTISTDHAQPCPVIYPGLPRKWENPENGTHRSFPNPIPISLGKPLKKLWKKNNTSLSFSQRSFLTSVFWQHKPVQWMGVGRAVASRAAPLFKITMDFQPSHRNSVLRCFFCPSYIVVNWWFGARWFGILRVPLSNNPFHKGSPGIQITKRPKQTINK